MNRSGFTLVEVLVALTVAGAVVVSVHRGFALMLDLQERAAVTREEAAEALAIRQQIIDWLRSAHMEGQPAALWFRGSDGTFGGETPDDWVVFATTKPGPFSAAWERVGLSIERDPRTEARGLVARTSPLSGTESDAALGPRVQVLAPTAEGLEVRYFVRLGSGKDWIRTWDDTDHAPAAVEILIFGDSLPPLLREPILVPLTGRV